VNETLIVRAARRQSVFVDAFLVFALTPRLAKLVFVPSARLAGQRHARQPGPSRGCFLRCHAAHYPGTRQMLSTCGGTQWTD
jgi:hypothetical protein